LNVLEKNTPSSDSYTGKGDQFTTIENLSGVSEACANHYKQEQKPSSTKILRTFLLEKDEGGEPCSFPSLLLPVHLREFGESQEVEGFGPSKRLKQNCAETGMSRHALEETAASCLSSPLFVAPLKSRANDDLSSPYTNITEIELIPGTLLRNLQETFTNLLDSRLRAYATILLRHSAPLVVSTQENGDEHTDNRDNSYILNNQKLTTLLGIASSLTLETSVTSFSPNTSPCLEWMGNRDISSIVQQDGPDALVVCIPIVMESVIDISLYGLLGSSVSEKQVLTVSFRTEGEMKGFFVPDKQNEIEAPLMKKTVMKLDAHMLLDSMMREARKVGLIVVNCVNSRFIASLKETSSEDSLKVNRHTSLNVVQSDCPDNQSDKSASFDCEKVAAAALLFLQHDDGEET